MPETNTVLLFFTQTMSLCSLVAPKLMSSNALADGKAFHANFHGHLRRQRRCTSWKGR